MKIQKIIDKAIAFVNAPIPDYMKSELKNSDNFNSMVERAFIRINEDTNLSIEKIWFRDTEMDDIYVIHFNLGYGTGKDDDYSPEDEMNFDGVDIYKINIADEIEYLIGCAFPNCKIER